MIVYVLAGSYKQFVEWCREAGFPSRGEGFVDSQGQKWRAVYCDDHGQNLCGIRYGSYIRVGTWWERSDEIKDLFSEHERLSQHVRIT